MGATQVSAPKATQRSSLTPVGHLSIVLFSCIESMASARGCCGGLSTEVDYRLLEGKTLSSICVASGALHKMIPLTEAQ